MKQYRSVKTRVIYDGKFHVFCYITNNYITLILNIIYLGFILYMHVVCIQCVCVYYVCIYTYVYLLVYMYARNKKWT